MLTTAEEPLEGAALFWQAIKEQRPFVEAVRRRERALKRRALQVWMGPPFLADRSDDEDDDQWYLPDRGDDDDSDHDHDHHYRNDGSDSDAGGDGGWSN